MAKRVGACLVWGSIATGADRQRVRPVSYALKADVEIGILCIGAMNLCGPMVPPCTLYKLPRWSLE
jgi:hypothetical protein